jgi:hypothetical protein
MANCSCGKSDCVICNPPEDRAITLDYERKEAVIERLVVNMLQQSLEDADADEENKS